MTSVQRREFRALMEARVAGLPDKMHKFILDLIDKSKPGNDDVPTIAYPKNELRVNDPELVDLELRGLVRVSRRDDAIVVCPTRSAVTYFTHREKEL